MEPLSKDTMAVWTALIGASRRLLDAVEAALKAADLPPLAWYDALLELERASTGGLRPFELRERLLLPQYGTSRLLDRLARAGYIERLTCPEDGRGQVVRITDRGRAVRAAMWPVYAGVLRDRIDGRLDDATARIAAEALERLGR